MPVGARSSPEAGCATGSSAGVHGRRRRGVWRPGRQAASLLEAVGRVDAWASRSRSTRWRRRRGASRASRKWGAGTAGSTSPAIPACPSKTRAAARLHDQRDPLRPAHERVLRPVRRPARPRRTRAQNGRRADVPDDSLRVLRALQFAARFALTMDEERSACAAGGPGRPASERVLGEFEKLLLLADRPSIGFALGSSSA